MRYNMRMLRFALIAHDDKKAELVDFCRTYREQLRRAQLIGTGTTGRRINEATGLEVKRMLSGPHGGDAQIAAEVATGAVNAVLFIVDPLSPHPHDPDIQGLLRVCNVHNVPVATNLAAAKLIVEGLLGGE